MAGYASHEYCESLAEFGTPRHLATCDGWLLERPIPGSDLVDAMGPYPLFSCRDWSRIGDDLRLAADRCVSVGLVADPFANVTPETLRRDFDIVKPLKAHFIVDLSMPLDQLGSRHHRYYGRKTRKEIAVEIAADPSAHLDEWAALYDELARRKSLHGIKAFSRAAFEKQLRVPGVELLVARRDAAILGAQIWMVQGTVAFSHLTAMSEAGYDERVSYAIYAAAIEHFHGKLEFLDLGGGAGTDDGAGGLADFKRGWATGTRIASFCGRIFNRAAYDKLSAGRNTEYFPAYRQGELA